MRWRWSYRSLIRPAWLVITAGPTRTVLPRGLRSRRQQGDRQLLAVVQYPRHPGHCVQLCIIHAWARRVLNPRCHRNIRARRQTCARRVCCPVACRGAQIASPTHPSLLHALRQIRDSRPLRGWRAMGGRFFNLTYSSRAWLGGRLHQRAAFRCLLPLASPDRLQALPSQRHHSTQLRCVFAAAH